MKRSPWEDREFVTDSLRSIDRQFLPGTKQEVAFLEKELELVPGAAIVDLGCGAGRHSIELAIQGYRMTGLDISDKMLQAAEERSIAENAKVEFAKCDLRQISSFFNGREAIFDGAICICESGYGVLGWSEDLKFLRDIYALLKNESKLILTTFNGIRKYRGNHIIAGSFDYIKGTTFWETPDDWPGKEKLEEEERVYIPSEVSMMFKLAGFVDIEILGCTSGAFGRQNLRPDDIEMMVIGSKHDG